MTTATIEEAPGVKPKDLRGFSRAVSTAVAALVNNRGVKYRIFKDGNHLVLYPPDRDARPFKISAHRSDEGNIRYLTEFVDKYLGPLPTDDRPAKPEELAKLHSLNTKPPEQRGAPNAETDADGPWTIHHRKSGEPTTFETNGTMWRCRADGCPWTTTKPGSLGAHAAHHASLAAGGRTHRPDIRKRAKPWAGRHPTEKATLDAARVRELRDRAGLTWNDLGRMLGITPEGIRQWLKRGECAAAWVEPFAVALGTTPEILTGTDPLPGPMISKPPSKRPKPPVKLAEAPAEPTTPEPTPEPSKPAPLARLSAEQEAALREVIRHAGAALGESDHAAELAEARAENEALRVELDEANARLDLLREAWDAVGGTGK